MYIKYMKFRVMLLVVVFAVLVVSLFVIIRKQELRKYVQGNSKRIVFLGTVTNWDSVNGVLSIEDSSNNLQTSYELRPEKMDVALFEGKDANPKFINSSASELWKSAFCPGNNIEVALISDSGSDQDYKVTQVYNFSPRQCKND